MSSKFNLKTALKPKSDDAEEIFRISAPDGYLTDIMRKIVDLFERQQFCDVTLISEDKEYEVKAHRVVLSAATEYFSVMFNEDFRESNAEEIPLPTNSHSLKIVINYIYTASIELTTDTVEDIMKTAQLFLLDSLVELCSEFMVKQLDTDNCMEIALYAEYYNFNTLYETASAFVCENFMKLRNDKEFYELNLGQLMKLISSDDLRVPTEEEVFDSVISWVQHDKTERLQYIDKLFHHIRFPLLLPEFIASTVEHACESAECKLLISNAYKWHLLPEFRLSLFTEEQSKLRNFKDMIIATSGWDSNERILNVGFFYQGLKEWMYRQWPAPPVRRNNFGSTTLNGKIVIAGGTFVSGDITNRVESFDPKTLKWSELPPLGTERWRCGMVTLDGCIYVLGGENGTGTLSSVEKYNPLTGQWQYVAPMRQPNSNPHVAVRFNSLCVSKKQVNRTYTNWHNIYEPSTDTWTDNWLTTNGELLGMGTVSVLSTDYFIAISRTAITRYNLAINTFSTIPTNSIIPQCTTCTVVGDRVIVHGPNDFQEYHLFQNEWKMMPRFINDQGRVLVFSN